MVCLQTIQQDLSDELWPILVELREEEGKIKKRAKKINKFLLNGLLVCQRRRRFDPQFFSFQPLLRMSLILGKPRFNLYFKFFYGYLRLVRDFHTIPGCDIWFPLTIGLCLVCPAIA